MRRLLATATIAALTLLATLAVLLAPRRDVRAAELPPKQLALLTLRALSYDHRVKARSPDGKSITLLILYQEGNPVSETLNSDLTLAMEELATAATLGGFLVRVASMSYDNPAALDAKLASLRPGALFICPGLRDALPAITAATRRRAVLSFTNSGAYVKAGISIGLLLGEERPAVVVHLAAARAEGAELDVALLRIAEVIR